jgi:hypothetical protein
MSIRNRALGIAFAGPAIQAIGIVWTLFHLLISHVHDSITARHVVFESSFLLIFVGFLVSIVCIPVALEVMRAREDDVSLPLLGREAADEAAPRERPALRTGE